MLKLESKAEPDKKFIIETLMLFNSNINIIYQIIASFILRIGTYQQISNEIMTNPGENQNRDHINTRVSFNFIHYMANLLWWGGAKWQNGSLLHYF